ncbi:toluene-4-monooxygenase system B family protein [Sneathiella litorea]|uniref:Toluene monooxygenase n=1 Tax=Sneathiella litorea TaxID=2606216 RepID=A0A6L8W3G6_9PROT|nr:toluene-4-monooxygenase system B family protein [Sneathiella litorea]MZR29636.1 hypothetical protein [Sneathiella litorea]
MDNFPLACCVQGDYGYKIIMVSETDTIAEVVKKALAGVVGYLVAPFPENTIFHARIHGSDDLLPNDVTVKDANLLKMEAIDISMGA